LQRRPQRLVAGQVTPGGGGSLEGALAEPRPCRLPGQHRLAPLGARSAADGPEPDGASWLAEDLGGRVAHAWLRRDGRRVSTLDLLGPGLTLFTGPDAAAWEAAATVDTPAPLAVQPLDGAAAAAVGTGGRGAALVRPDGQVAARWPAPAPDTGVALRRAVARLVDRGGVAGAG
jgi:hypothetical protein